LSLIKSISGIRGTIGGSPGENLTPIDVVESTAAFAAWTRERHEGPPTVVVGRDGRISGPMVLNLVTQTLISMGIHVIDLDLTTTPTVEMAVVQLGAQAGIICTASHNPKQWNALKFLNERGEFISKADGEALLSLLKENKLEFAGVNDLGTYQRRDDLLEQHIQKILGLELVDAAAIAAKNYKVVVDGINSSGAIAVPALLEKLGVEVELINGEVNGRFAHQPEPLPENLIELGKAVNFHKAHLGIAVDPDVDRLAFVCEDGEVFGEEYTLVAVADYILKHKKGPAVSNLSSTRALRDVAQKHGVPYFAAAVGEVNVVTTMKQEKAVIGGEGNGGVIYPAMHYGRDALTGIALFLTHFAKSGVSASRLRGQYPNYVLVKDKMQLTPGLNIDDLLKKLEQRYRKEEINTIDGLKIDLENGWVHLRKSNTEPIIRIYAESHSGVIANHLIQKIKSDVQEIRTEM
jgi:phosphomannomutase